MRRALMSRCLNEAALFLVEPRTKVEVCRDPGDVKFLGCAVDARTIHKAKEPALAGPV